MAGQCQVRASLCVFVSSRTCLCVFVWSAAMLLDSRWHYGWQGRGCLAQLIRQLRIGQLGGLLASRVRMYVCVCVCVYRDVDSGGPIGMVTRPCHLLLLLSAGVPSLTSCLLTSFTYTLAAALALSMTLGNRSFIFHARTHTHTRRSHLSLTLFCCFHFRSLVLIKLNDC